MIKNIRELEEYLNTSNDPPEGSSECFNELIDKLEKQKQEIEKLKQAMINKHKYTSELEKDLFENCSNYVISKDKIRHILLKFQNEYGEDLETTGRLFIGKEVMQYGEDMIDEMAKELDIKLLEEEL